MSSIFTVCYSDLRCSASSLHSVPSPFLFLRSRLAVELVITNVRPARLFSFSFFIIYLYSGVSFVLFFLLPSRYAHSEFLFRCFFCCYHFLMIFCWYSSVSRRHSSEGTESSALCYYRERKTTARRCGWTCSLPFNSPWLLFFLFFRVYSLEGTSFFMYPPSHDFILLPFVRQLDVLRLISRARQIFLDTPSSANLFDSIYLMCE